MDRRQSNNSGLTAGHRFQPGNKHGHGRPAGSRNKATIALQAMLDGEGEAIMRRAIELATEGDPVALRLCVERLVPPVKESRIRVAMPQLASAADTAAAISRVFQAVAGGRITPSEGQALAALLETHRKAIETADLEERLARLESAAEKQR